MCGLNKNVLVNMWQSECKTTLNSTQISFWKKILMPKEKFKKDIACGTARIKYLKWPLQASDLTNEIQHFQNCMKAGKLDFIKSQMFFYCYLSTKMGLLNEISVAASFFKGGIRLSWLYTILKFIKIKFDENLTVWFNGTLLFLQ